MMLAPASTKSCAPCAVTTLPATIGTVGLIERIAAKASSIFFWWPCAVSTTNTSAPDSIKAAAFAATSPLIPTAAAIRKRPCASTAGEYKVPRSAPIRVMIPTRSPLLETTGANL